MRNSAIKNRVRRAMFLVVLGISTLWLSGCAAKGGRAEFTPIPESCTSVVVEDALIDDTLAPVRTANVRSRGGYGSSCYTLPGLRSIARRTACEEGFELAHLYNIQPPGLFTGRCALADIDFYAEAPAHRPSPEPVITYDTLPLGGLEVYFTAGVGSAVGGRQADPGLTPKPNVEKVSLGMAAEYYFGRLGVEAGADFLGMGTARKDGYPDMDLYQTGTLRLGGAATLWHKTLLTSRLKLDAGVGANYVLLQLADEYIDFLNNPFIITEPGGGFGYYGKLRFKSYLYNGLVASVGVQYEYENPKLEGASQSLDAHVVQMVAGLGYKF